MKFKFINLNVWRGGELFDEIIDFLKKEKPDVLTIQEVFNGSDKELPRNERTLEILTQEIGYRYFFFSKCFRDESSTGKIDRGNAILSKFPIVETDEVFYGKSYGIYSGEKVSDFPTLPKTIQRAKIQLNGVNINVFNTQGVWGADGQDNKDRLEMSRLIVDQVKEKENVVLAGDFNVKPNTETIQNIEKLLKNVFKDELITTFNMKRKTNPGYATAVVDMIFVSDNLSVTSHKCPQVDISDHLPLVCEFEVG